MGLGGAGVFVGRGVAVGLNVRVRTGNGVFVGSGRDVKLGTGVWVARTRHPCHSSRRALPLSPQFTGGSPVTTAADTAPILEVKDLQTYFFTRTGTVKAVDGVSFELYPGETLGVVGESGSGKSMTALSIMGLVPGPAGRAVGGQILYNGEDLLQKSAAEMRAIRGREICMILQDPMTSLNPVYTVGNQVIETLRQGSQNRSTGIRARAIELLEKVKIPSPEVRFSNFPHQMSGGMRQRRRGHHVPGRHHPVSVPRPPPGVAAGYRHGHHVHHPRLRHRRQDVRPRRRDVRRPRR